MTRTQHTSWAETREHYTRAYGAPPDFQADNDGAALFRQHPAAVIAELERIAQGHAAGKVHTPWRLFAKSLDKIAGDQAHVDVTRDLRVRQAEAWVRNAGGYCTAAEVRQELFHATGALLPGLEAELGDHLEALWAGERPRFKAAEAAVLERAERFVAGRNRLAAPAEASDFGDAA